MTMKLYAVRDVKADAFGAPMSIATKGLALRSFSDACLQPNSELGRYPEDYMLYELGSYEPNSGKIDANALPVFLASATDVIAKARSQAADTLVHAEVIK